MENGLLVSVAVATHQRRERVLRLIDALEKQTLDPERFEVVITDDASTDGTYEALEEAVARSPLRLSILRNEHNLGAAGSRNRAWRSAAAPIVAFTDDDCIPTSTWLDAGVAAADRGPSVLVGETKPNPDQKHLLDPLARTLDVSDATFAPTANVFYHREDLEAVDGFDEAFGTLGGEDTDLAWRVHRQCGRPLVFEPRALVHHDVRRRTTAEAIADTRRWEGLALLASRHRELARGAWHRGHFMRSWHPMLIAAVVGLAIGTVLPPALALVVPWLRVRILTGRPRLGWIRSLRHAPSLFAVDVAEVFALARGSLRHRVFLL